MFVSQKQHAIYYKCIIPLREMMWASAFVTITSTNNLHGHVTIILTSKCSMNSEVWCPTQRLCGTLGNIMQSVKPLTDSTLHICLCWTRVLIHSQLCQFHERKDKERSYFLSSFYDSSFRQAVRKTDLTSCDEHNRLPRCLWHGMDFCSNTRTPRKITFYSLCHSLF